VKEKEQAQRIFIETDSKGSEKTKTAKQKNSLLLGTVVIQAINNEGVVIIY